MKIFDFDVYPHNGLINISDFNNYTTGIHTLDTFLFEELDVMETHNKTALSVAYVGDTVVGMFALSTAQTISNKSSEQANHTFGDVNKQYDSIPLISIDHFSVSKNLQYDGSKRKDEQFNVGKSLLRVIYELVVKMRTKYNVAIAGISVDALPHAADWYEKQHFVYLNDFEENSPNKEYYKMIIGYPMIEKAYFEAMIKL